MASSARIDELRKKFEENPRRYFAPLANEYRKAGEIDQAIAICREYLPQQPGHMSGHIVYGQALYEARQFEEAKTVFETALSLDPENLIALRHLGDIALIVGDTEGARTWYRRVLEADPRNEEIQAQLARLDRGEVPAVAAPGAPSAAAGKTPTPAGSVAQAPAPALKPTPSSSPTVVMNAVRPPEAAPQAAPPQAAATAPPAPSAPAPVVTADSPTGEIALETISHRPEPQEQLLDTVVEIPTTSAADYALGAAGATNAGMAPQPALELESPVGGSSSQEAPPIDGFSLEGLETTSLAAPEPAAPPPPAALDLDFGSIAAAPAPAPIPDLDFGKALAATPPAPAASPAPAVAEIPVPELLDLGAPAPTASVAPPSPTADIPFIDLGEIGAPAAASAPPPQAAPPAAPPAAVPSLDDFGLDLDAPSPAPRAAPDAGPFVTETMAELYLKQGHREEALRVYRALLEQRPGDATLMTRVSTLEAELAPPAPTPSVSRPAVAATSSAGPTIREILRVVATRRPGYRPELPGQNGSTPAAPPAPAGASSHAFAPDAIGALFAATPVSAENEAAAVMLALAFPEMNGNERAAVSAATSGIPGEPARRAPNELSLDAVFGESARPNPPSNFSFDQFFSQRAASEPPTGAGQGEASVQSREDVAQFTQWLEGLKQR